MSDLTELIGLSPPVDTSKPYDASTLRGKTVLLTGGANGLGAAFARHWAGLGAHLVIGDVDDSAGEALVAELRSQHGGSHRYLHCDVTVWEQQVALFREAAGGDGDGIDVVVANAGYLSPASATIFENPVVEGGAGAFPESPARPDTKILEINSIGVAYTVHLALFWLPRNRDGVVVPPPASGRQGQTKDRALLLMGSIASLIALPTQAQYCMSKHAVMGLFRSLRGTAWRHGVRLNMLCPYYVGGSNMLPAAAHLLLLSGGAGPATIPDTIDAATRLVADASVAGRALAVGPPLRGLDQPDAESGLEIMVDRDGRKLAAWDCYADDYRTTEVFSARLLTVMGAVEKAKGWIGWAADVARFVFRAK